MAIPPGLFGALDPTVTTAPGAPSPMAPSQGPAAAGAPLSSLTAKQIQTILALQGYGQQAGDLDAQEARIAASRSHHSTGDNVYSSIGGNLGDFFRGLYDNNREEDLQQKRSALNEQSLASRKEFFNALQKGEQPDISSLLYADEASAPEKGKAYAQALRGQQQLAQLGMLSGDPQLAGIAKSLLEGAGKGGEQMQSALDMRLRRATEAERARREQEFQQFQEKHMANEDAATGKRLDLENAPKFIQGNGNAPPVIFDPRRKTATVVGGLGGGEPGGPLTPKQAKDLDEKLGKLKDDLDPSRGRNGLFGQDRGLVTSADKVRALVKNPETGAVNYNLTVEQMPEFVQSVAGMLANGGHAAQSQLEHLMPHTAKMSIAQKMEWLTGHPEVANAPEFVKQYYETADREQKLAQERIRNVQLDRVSAHQGGYALFPDQMKNTARQYLKDLSPEDLDLAFQGKYDRTAKPKGGAPGGGGLSPADQKAVDWAKKNPTNPDAQAILKLHPNTP